MKITNQQADVSQNSFLTVSNFQTAYVFALLIITVIGILTAVTAMFGWAPTLFIALVQLIYFVIALCKKNPPIPPLNQHQNHTTLLSSTSSRYQQMVDSLKQARITLTFPTPTVEHLPNEEEVVFNKNSYENSFGWTLDDPMVSFPQEMEAMLDSPCSIWSGKTVRQTHIRLYIPAKINGQDVTLDSFIKEIKEAYQQGRCVQGMGGYWDTSLGRAIHAKVKSSYWILVPKAILSGSRGLSYDDQLELMKEYSAKSGFLYQDPKAIEILIAIIAHNQIVQDFKKFAYTGEHIDYPLETRCHEIDNYGVRHLTIGRDNYSGVSVFREPENTPVSLLLGMGAVIRSESFSA